MKQFNPECTIAALSATVAGLFGTTVDGPLVEPPLASVIDNHWQECDGAALERCLIFCPDALGVHIWEACPNHLETISLHAPLRVSLSSVVPPKTPVCFASMLTGVPPSVHGIRKYERPVLKCETLFDALIRTKRKIAVVAVRNSSIDLIFRGRGMDYFSEEYDGEVLERAIDVVTANRHDLVLVYQQEYDDLLHKTEPFSDECLHAASNHVDSFAELALRASEAWRAQPHALVFAPDHGAHLDLATGHGDHGADIPEDMQLYHWYGVRTEIPPVRS